MKKFPGIINKTNYSEVWEFVARKNCRAKQCAAIEKVSAILGNLLFLLLVLFFGCGMLIQYNIPMVVDFLKAFSWLYDPWLKVAIWLSGTGLSQPGQIVLCVVLVYMVPFMICAVLALLICLCYRPTPPGQPEGTELERAEALRKLGKQTRSLARSSTAGAATWSTILFLVAVGVLVTIFILQTYQNGVLDINEIMSNRNLTLILMISAFGLLFGYAFVNYILLKLLELLHICRLPKEMMYTLELYCEQNRPEESSVKKETL